MLVNKTSIVHKSDSLSAHLLWFRYNFHPALASPRSLSWLERERSYMNKQIDKDFTVILSSCRGHHTLVSPKLPAFLVAFSYLTTLTFSFCKMYNSKLFQINRWEIKLYTQSYPYTIINRETIEKPLLLANLRTEGKERN